MPATVDADLFPTLDDAIRFVAERGGGTVHTSYANTLYAKSLKLPPNVRLAPARPPDPPPAPRP